MPVIESHASYVDFNYYQQTFHGTMSEIEFERARIEAEAFVDSITFGRIARLDVIPDAVKNAVCAATDEINRRNQSQQQHSGIKSESNDGASVTYDDAISDDQCRANMSAKARMYLANTGLLYRGFSKGYDRR
ncbi:MAG: hypothetical protein Q4D42_13180 [Eubacteriales bacterium]|nr:hypothetical protein [Eubacteriales bacterium]